MHTSRPIPRIGRDAFPTLTAGQMRQVDRIMIEELQVTLPQMMENAGRSLAELTVAVFRPHTVAVLAGPGGNGGGGLVAARHLANHGVHVHVVVGEPEALKPVPALQLEILRRMQVPIAEEPQSAGLIIDALLGYSLQGDPRGRTGELIEWANRQAAPVLALDTPSGLDVATGRAATPCVTAAATVTLALPKAGLLKAPRNVGRLYLADISVPPSVYGRLGVGAPPHFGDAWIVELVP